MLGLPKLTGIVGATHRGGELPLLLISHLFVRFMFTFDGGATLIVLRYSVHDITVVGHMALDVPAKPPIPPPEPGAKHASHQQNGDRLPVAFNP